MELKWSEVKNQLLKETRGICFEMIEEAIAEGHFVGPEVNPVHEWQHRIIVNLDGYPYVVPFVIDEKGDWFLKTAYPDRKQKGRV